MSCHLIYYENGAKKMRPILSEEEYRKLRGTPKQYRLTKKARRGDTEAKMRLLQINYSCLPNEDGTLKGSSRMANSVGMDVDLDKTLPDFEQRMKEVAEKILKQKDELGLLMLERSATKGYHVVFRRRRELSQEGNLQWASNLLGVPFDSDAKDMTRVFFSTTDSEQDLLYVNKELFNVNEDVDVDVNVNVDEDVNEDVNEDGEVDVNEDGDVNVDEDVKSPSTLDSGLSTLDPRPSTLDPGLLTLDPRPLTLKNSNKNEGENTRNGAASDNEMSDVGTDNGGKVDDPANPLYSDNYDGVDYPTIVGALAEQLGGVPNHGSRNNFIYAMACNLRYVCNDDPEWIARVLPTYGEEQEKWKRTIESACNRVQKQHMPEVMKRALDRAKLATTENEEDPYKDIPPLPDKLPKVIRLLTSKVPDMYKPAVAQSVFPALASHLYKVHFRYIDNVEHEATVMNVLLAPQSIGKSCVNTPIDHIMADIRARDATNRKREQEWLGEINTKGANKDKKERPKDLCIQYVMTNMTGAALVRRMEDANEHFIYSRINEIELLDKLNSGNGKSDVSEIVRLAFDCGEYGQERVGTQSVTAIVNVRWNWNASSTIDRGVYYLRNGLMDGTVSRLTFCTIVPPKEKPQGKKMLPIFGNYDEKYTQELAPYIELLNQAQGEIQCKQAESLAWELLEENAEKAELMDDNIFEILSWRANVQAYIKAMILYILNGRKWSREIEEFVRWSIHYDLWCKMFFFTEQMERLREKNGTRRSGPQNMLNMLSDEFTLKDLEEIRSILKKKKGAKYQISNWINRGFVEINPQTGKFQKTEKYKKRKF